MSMSVNYLKKFYDKNGLTLKDWVILNICVLLDVDGEKLEEYWDLVFEAVEKLAGTRMENVPLASLCKKVTGRPPIEQTDLLAKFWALEPYSYMKQRELDKAGNKNQRDTAAYNRLKRVRDSFNKANPQSDPWIEILALMRDQMEAELAKPEGERCTMGDIAFRAGREFGAKLFGNNRQRSASPGVFAERAGKPTRCPRCGAPSPIWDDEDRVYKCMLCGRVVTPPNN